MRVVILLILLLIVLQTDASSSFRVSIPTTYDKIMAYNRHTLQTTGPLHDETIMKIWNQNGGPSILNAMGMMFQFDYDQYIGDNPTLADAIGYSAILLMNNNTNAMKDRRRIQYLEIGIYNGRTFRQLTNLLGSESLSVSMDLITMNPRLIIDGNWVAAKDHGCILSLPVFVPNTVRSDNVL